MKETLRSQLETYKKDNTKSSKEAMLATMDSITNTLSDNDSSTLNSIAAAKSAINASRSNKGDIVQSVESVISNLS